MFFFERFLERLSHSKYKLNFVIKGGLLISSMIGIDNRTTMDMDVTVKGFSLKEEVIKNIILEILDIEVSDGIQFEVTNITHIHEKNEYENFRVHLIAIFGKIKNAMKIDITTGDVITPKEIEYVYPCMFEKEGLKVLAYPVETILAEKYESVIKRNISTTRMRDFYDLYSLYRLRKKDIDFSVLKRAILSTAKKRDSMSFIQEANEIINDIREDNYLKELWKLYSEDNPYIKKLDFLDTVEALKIIAEKIEI
ncbi:nucleotidyl transferase AbiEii/AbiGii toxin family protein [Mycoplasma enhydrae]|uniref:nucleotidyl transferase AbiEii/AbiGii toxin family protein n=1 Tax=Mycoplasma enhydrae TaxID=2499220 RepID=UPI00197C1662|nr:nucleotidyl transferase AbiEii/AbiGii toxin family protein [Mycoplasma enhydrae]MBN4089657.1 nucleotidyl transferase AbiEii/AbiGii toxin family protein [Mycoplasma enhydrae]